MPPKVWKGKVSEAIEAITKGKFKKVVLARSQTITAERSLHQVLENLRQYQPDAYVFAFARNDSCFLGATPERLIKLCDGRLSTCALAGSTARSEDPAEDERLGQTLLDSAKDLREHRIVADELRIALSGSCNDLETTPYPRLRKLKHVQHLMTAIEGRAKKGASLLALVEQLHPSSAVGGLPRDDAINYIRDHEDMDRGWYAGPVGWIDGKGEGEFAVALRSALLWQGRATLFAGCGIVQASRPDDEFRESAIKMSTMTSALGAEHQI